MNPSAALPAARLRGRRCVAGDHDSVIIRPVFHYRAALECCVDVPADGIPGFAAELAVHQVIEVILLRCALEQKGVARFEERARAGFGISQVFFL